MGTGTIECRDLTKRYGKETTALKRLSFSIPTKGIFALIGRNGAGKTTLIRILATELAPTSGTASINGIDVVKEPERIRTAIAVLPQEARAIPWLTAEQEVFSSLLYRGIGYAESKRRTDSVLTEFGIAKYKDTPSRKLSGGTKRKLLVAAIVASGAKILFVDEPTTGLDPLSRMEMWDMLSRLKKDRFIFLTTHYLEEAERLADNIGIIDKGRLMGIGTLDE
ncbi:MAG: ABC transporter ATP-binding protein, partial [Candidatus Micrarchaeaceae archaeon]